MVLTLQQEGRRVPMLTNMKTLECKKLKSWCKKVKFSRKVQMPSKRTKVHKLKNIDNFERRPNILKERRKKSKEPVLHLADVSSISTRSLCESGIESLDTSPESKTSLLNDGNMSLPAISINFENFIMKDFAANFLQSSTPMICPKNRKATIEPVDSQRYLYSNVLPGYLGNSPDKSSLGVPSRRKSIGVCTNHESEKSIFPQRMRKFASWFKSGTEGNLPQRKKHLKRKHKSLGTENHDLGTDSSDKHLEFLEGLNPTKRAVFLRTGREIEESYSFLTTSDASDEAPLLIAETHRVKLYIARRRALQTEFDKLQSEAQRLKEKDLKIKQKFLELQRKRVLLSLDLNPNSTAALPNTVKQTSKSKTMPLSLRKWGLSKSTPNLVECSDVKKLIPMDDI